MKQRLHGLAGEHPVEGPQEDTNADRVLVQKTG